MPAIAGNASTGVCLTALPYLKRLACSLQRGQEKLREGQNSSLRDTQSESCLVGESSSSFMNAGYFLVIVSGAATSGVHLA